MLCLSLGFQVKLIRCIFVPAWWIFKKNDAKKQVANNRREFLKKSALLGGAGVAGYALSTIQNQVLAIPSGTQTDVLTNLSFVNPYILGASLPDGTSFYTTSGDTSAVTKQSSTTTGGVQEALTASVDQGVILLNPGVQSTSALSITKNISIISLVSGNPNYPIGIPSGNSPAVGDVTISASAENIWSIKMIGITMPSLALSAA